MNRDVTLRLLRYFETLGRELNYRRAAERLYISQPALSSAIRQLEGSVGARLFDRDTHSVSLTEVGREWLPHVRSALREVDSALDAAASIVDSARVRIGYLIGTGADLLFQLLDGVDQALPGLTVETTEFDFTDPSAGLASGACDIALLRPPVDVPDLQSVVVAEESWVACLPRTHRLAGRTELRIEELLDEPLVVAPGSAGVWRDYWMASDARGGRPAHVAAEAATYEAETTLIARGVGISFTTSSLRRLYDRPGIRFVPILDRPVSYTCLAWRPDRLSAPAWRLVQHLRDRIPATREHP
ncbi:LysR family transcriptional regulator [Kineococcus rhizosphaerae]|uniref:DNA-binding transcriptional LysR family regulator n=1 Tax=Kineococcus rhizosphaerae TaxID=559628 RepID=A0A2T0RBL2_9ACTN|nr:LysR family transcriptional regulator [Kineococcus rhizosphaerae]PRY18558.1 DNA-binding transcriptional LysR family regulator [Kineococcus rhizosphaerae]